MKILTEIFSRSRMRDRGQALSYISKETVFRLDIITFSKRPINKWNRLSADSVGAITHSSGAFIVDLEVPG